MCLGAIGRVVAVEHIADLVTARVDFGDRTADVGVLAGDEPAPGAYVLVHAGFVLEVLDEDRATEALELRAHIAGLDPG